MIQHFLQFKKDRKNKKSKKSLLSAESDEQLENPGTTLIAPYFVSSSYQINEIVNVEEFSPFRMSFSAIGLPLPSFSWYLDNKDLNTMTQVCMFETSVENEQQGHISTRILFDKCLREHSGVIQCVAANGLGLATFQINLNIHFKPTIAFSESDSNDEGLIFSTGEMLRLKAVFCGNPKPEVFWFFGEQEAYEITTEDKVSILKIDQLKRSNCGEYVVEARNEIGSSRSKIFVTVVSRPNAPYDLKIEWTYSGALLSWLKPVDDGGSDVTKYIIDYYRKGWDLWLKLTDSVEEAFFIENLIENSDYKFRVKAENCYGVSDPSEETQWIHVVYTKIADDDLNEKQQLNEDDDEDLDNLEYLERDVDNENDFGSEIDADSSGVDDNELSSDNIDFYRAGSNGNNSPQSDQSDACLDFENFKFFKDSIFIFSFVILLFLLDDFFVGLILFLFFVYCVVEKIVLQI